MNLFSLLFLILFSLQALVPLMAQRTVVVDATLNITLDNDEERRVVLRLDGAHAPLSLANFWMLARPIDQDARNTLSTQSNNPYGNYRAIDPDTGYFDLDGATYTINVTGEANPSSPNNYLPGAEATLRIGTTAVATFTLASPGNQHNWVSDNPLYSLSYYSTSDPEELLNYRYQLNLTSSPNYLNEFSGQITSGAYYDNRPLNLVSGDTRYLSLGAFTFGNNKAPGWQMQNEIVDADYNNFDAPDAVFGNRFADRFGNLSGQGFAVAFANENLTDLNTAGATLLITGAEGAPQFRGRHTHLGYVKTDYAGRVTVQELLGGVRSGTVTSIDFTLVEGLYEATYYYDQIPGITLKPGSPSLKTVDGVRRVTTNALEGEIRQLLSSDDLINWVNYVTSAFPVGLAEEPGVSIENLINGTETAYFSVGPTVITYPSWPAMNFETADAYIRFKGRENDIEGAAQVVNTFNILFDEAGTGGVLQGVGGDLAGTHAIQNVSFVPDGPFSGILRMESETLAEPVRLLLYFDSHKIYEDPSVTGNNVIDRYHRIITQVVEVPPFGEFEFDARSEFGIWQIQ
ncbi:MAG: hypothetical protein Q7Q71_08105 [Verrucomicrobiota bacterium JB023]|nr:hypothetical protein [Verrucomicrobiota bacterium JB023]